MCWSMKCFLLLKLDNPEYELELEQTDLCELVRSVCAEYYEELEDKGIEMHIEIPETSNHGRC